MKPRPKFRKILKWMSLFVSTLLAVMWVGSAWVQVELEVPVTDCGVLLTRGLVYFSHIEVDLPDVSDVPFSISFDYVDDQLGAPSFIWGFRRLTSAYVSMVGIPLWLPLLVAFAGVILAFWKDIVIARRKLSGSCLKCDYDRRGLAADAKCPECGLVPSAPVA